MIKDSFASGDVSGRDDVGGLAGTNRGTIQNSYALGQTSCSGTDCAVGGLVGVNYAESNAGTSYPGTLRRAYYNSEANTSDPGAVGDNTNTDDAGSTTGVIEDTSAATEAEIKALTCSTAVFEDSDGDDCATAGAANFPWDFGTSSELPVLNGVIGGLDAEGQRDLIEP